MNTLSSKKLAVRLLKDVYDDGQDHHPPGYVGRKGDVVYIHSVQTAVVSHDGTGHGFIVHDGELDLVTEHAHETCDELEKAARDRFNEVHQINPRDLWELQPEATKDTYREWVKNTQKANSCVCGEPNSPGTHRTDGPCLAPIGDHHP